VYSFIYKDRFLKIGKAGPNSKARFTNQHYNFSVKSTLSKSLLKDIEMKKVLPLNKNDIGKWVKVNTRRVDFLLDENLGPFILTFVEAYLQLKYEPKYEV
jgi:hypothetical protein